MLRLRSNRQHLWIKISLCGLLGSGGVVGPFDEFALLDFAPARTSATRWGALTARPRDWAASISLWARRFRRRESRGAW